MCSQDNQGDLEMATECLSEYLERDITEDTLSNMKTMVQDKTKLVSPHPLSLSRISLGGCGFI